MFLKQTPRRNTAFSELVTGEDWKNVNLLYNSIILHISELLIPIKEDYILSIFVYVDIVKVLGQCGTNICIQFLIETEESNIFFQFGDC